VWRKVTQDKPDAVHRYYAAYLQFFHQSVNTLGPKKTFENYILSDEAVSVYIPRQRVFTFPPDRTEFDCTNVATERRPSHGNQTTKDVYKIPNWCIPPIYPNGVWYRGAFWRLLTMQNRP
jgi:hypothetical protein